MIDQATWFTDEKATFGDRLAEAREQSGMSQQDVADRLGVDVSSIEAWEDDLRDPRANRLTILAGMFGVTLSWLMTGKGDGPDLVPDDAEPARPDLMSLLAEMRDLRGDIGQAGDRLARLEKRLRKAITDGADGDA